MERRILYNLYEADYEEEAQKAYFSAEKIIKQGGSFQDIPRELIDRIMLSGMYSSLLAILLMTDRGYKPSEIPIYILSDISFSVPASYDFVTSLITLGYKNEVDNPSNERIKKIVLKLFSEGHSVYWMALNLVRSGYKIQDIPKSMVKRIIDSSYIWDFIYKLLDMSYSFSDIKDFIIGASNNIRDTYGVHTVVKELLDRGVKLSELPVKLIKSAVEDDTHDFAVNLVYKGVGFYDFPKELTQSILKNSYQSYGLIECLIKDQKYKLEEIPKELIKSVLKSSEYSYNLIELLVREQKYKLSEIPKEFFQKTLENSEMSYFLTRFLIEYGYKLEEVPKELIQSVSRDSGYSYYLIDMLIRNHNYKLQEIPKVLIQSVLKSRYKEEFLKLVHIVKLGLDL